MSPSIDPSSHVLEPDSDETSDELERGLGSIAQLLYLAAKTVWDRADEEGPASPLHSLGLGIYLAHAQAQLLLPENRQDDDPAGSREPFNDDKDMVDRGVLNAAVDATDPCTAVQLLTEVEKLSRPLPLWRADLVDGSRLMIDLGDLLREAQHLGC